MCFPRDLAKLTTTGTDARRGGIPKQNILKDMNIFF